MIDLLTINNFEIDFENSSEKLIKRFGNSLTIYFVGDIDEKGPAIFNKIRMAHFLEPITDEEIEEILNLAKTSVNVIIEYPAFTQSGRRYFIHTQMAEGLSFHKTELERLEEDLRNIQESMFKAWKLLARGDGDD